MRLPSALVFMLLISGCAARHYESGQHFVQPETQCRTVGADSPLNAEYHSPIASQYTECCTTAANGTVTCRIVN